MLLLSNGHSGTNFTNNCLRQIFKRLDDVAWENEAWAVTVLMVTIAGKEVNVALVADLLRDTTTTQ